MYYVLFCLMITHPDKPLYMATFDGFQPKVVCAAVAEGLARALSDEENPVKCICKPTVQT